MAHFCARVRKRGDLPSVSMKDVYRASDDQKPGGGARGRARPALPSRRFQQRSSCRRRRARVEYVLCGALQALFFLGYSYVAVLAAAAGYEWISAGSGAVEHLPAVWSCSAARLSSLCAPFRSLAKWLLIGRWKPEQIRIWSLAYVRFWIVKTLDPVEPVRPAVRRLAPVRALSKGARRENRAGRRDLLPARAGVHRSAHDRRGDGDPQRVVFPLLPGTGGADRDRTGHPRPGRVRRRKDRARHQHVDGRRGAARSRLRAAQRPGGTGRRAVARLSGTAHRGELPESPAGSVRHAASGQLLRAHACSSVLLLYLPLMQESLELLVDGGAVAGPGSGPERGCERRCRDVAGALHRARWSSRSLLFFVGVVLVGLLLVVTVPRVLSLFLKPDTVYPLYGFHDAVHRVIARMGTLRVLCASLRRQLLHRPLLELAWDTACPRSSRPGRISAAR